MQYTSSNTSQVLCDVSFETFSADARSNGMSWPAQIDTPTRLFHEPASEFVFTFIGESCCLPVNANGAKVSDAKGAALDLRLARKLKPGGWRLYVRPSRLKIGKQAEKCGNRITAEIAFSEFLGDFWRYHLKAGALELFCDYAGPENFKAGQKAPVGWDDADMSVFQ